MEAYSSSLVRTSLFYGDTSLADTTALFSRYFFNRTDLLAVSRDGQTPKPLPANDFSPWIKAHLTGNIRGKPSRVRIGTYGPALDGTTRFLCLDFDGLGHANPLQDPSAAALETQRAFEVVGIRAYLERSGSGKGWHLWVFFEAPIAAALVRQLAFALLPKNIPLESGKPADPKKGYGIEVFPKQDKATGKGVGTLVWLPFWHHAQTGANLFYQRIDKGLESFTPKDFETVSLSQVKRLVAQLCPKPVAPKETKAVKDSGLSPKRWEEWRTQALSRLCLDDIYGPWLTGKQKSSGWLECRDPGSPSGDKRPSAGVATGNGKAEKGKFSSFISGESLSVFDFLLQHGGCSSLKSAYERVAQLSGVPVPKQKTKDEVFLPDRYREQWERAQAIERNASAPLSLTEVEEALLQALHQAERVDGITALETAPGAGKTRAVLRYAHHPLAGITALCTHTHQLNRELQQKAQTLSLGVRRLFSPTSKDGLKDERGERVCKTNYLVVQAEYDAGRSGPSICAQCIFAKTCNARLGSEGTIGAQLVLSTQSNPRTEEAARFIVDEAPKLLTLRDTSERDLEDCAKLCDSIHYTQRKIAAEAAKSVLSWMSAGGAPEANPIHEIREKILEVIEGKDEVKPAGLYDPQHPERKTQAQRDAGAWRAARWLFALSLSNAQPFVQTKRKGKIQENIATFAEKSRIAKTLSELPRAVILDATMSAHSLALLEKITGKKMHRVAFDVKDSATIERTWQPYASGARRYLTAHGKPLFTEPLQQLITRSRKWLSKHTRVKKLLVVSHKPIAAAFSLAWSDLLQLPPDLALVTYWRDLFATEDLATKALQTATLALLPMLSQLRERGGELGVAWYGALRGLDQWKDFDGCITLGDPYPDLDAFQRERALLRDGRAPTQEQEEEDWQAYLEECAAELAQAHGRLRAPSRQTEASLLHLGGILPKGWKPSQTLLDYQPVGRPKRDGEELPLTWYEGLRLAVQRAGSVRALARATGLSASVLLRYETKVRVPTTEAFDKIDNYIKGLTSAPEMPIAQFKDPNLPPSPPLPSRDDVPSGSRLEGGSSLIGISGALPNDAPEAKPSLLIGISGALPQGAET
jgi:hypothetical protein